MSRKTTRKRQAPKPLAKALTPATALSMLLPWAVLLLLVLLTRATQAAEAGGIDRQTEGRLFYTTIKIPANAEQLYVSGAGASAKADGSWGNMEEQAVDIFTKYKATLEAQGWSLSDIIQVRVFAVADEFGMLDFEGFNRGYLQFFGTAENPNKPVRSFVQVEALVNPNWLAEVEIRAARVP
jgi:enamine deaminase RidA (YjgF/YER057c/UK114 family)